MNMIKETNFIISTQEELDSLLNLWMEKLELFDWEIHAVFADNLDSDCGRITYEQTNKKGILEILRFDKFSSEFFGWDMEQTLVHELLHVKFSDFNCNNRRSKVENMEYIKMHQLIEDLARVLVRLKREE